MQSVEIQAAVCREFAAPLQLETLTLAPPESKQQAQQVRVKLDACAICHSDIIYIDGGWGGTLPMVLGHEAVGVVTDAGDESGFTIGARVLVTLMRSCGGCIYCAKKLPALCSASFTDAPHLHDKKGEPVIAGLKTAAFAQQVLVDKSQLALLDVDLSDAEASLLSCGVMTGWGAVLNTAKVTAGASVAVLGCGGVGLNCLQAAAYCGADVIVAVDTADAKLTLAQEFGATHALNPTHKNFQSEVQKISNGFDFVFMAAGSGRAVEQAASMVGVAGTLILAGMPRSGDFASLDATTIASSHQQLLGSKMGGAQLSVDIPRLLSLYRDGHLKLSQLVGTQYPLSEINTALAHSRQGETLRNVIMFDN